MRRTGLAQDSANFYDWFDAAARYFVAARMLVDSPDYASRAREVMRPGLMLIGQGLELLMKGNLLACGHPLQTVKGVYHHDLRKLWKAPDNQPLRGCVYAAASRTYAEAAENHAWQDEFADDPLVLVDAYVDHLARLHGTEAGYALRYPSADKGLRGPRLPFLAYTFHDVGDTAVRMPRSMVPDALNPPQPG